MRMEGVHPPPFTLSTIMSKAFCGVRSRADTHPLFLLYPYMYSMFLAVLKFVLPQVFFYPDVFYHLPFSHVWLPICLPACHLECQSACQPICQPAYPLVVYVNLFVSPLHSKVRPSVC